MKTFAAFLIVSFLLVSSAFAQSDIKMRTEYGADNADLQSVLYFENN